MNKKTRKSYGKLIKLAQQNQKMSQVNTLYKKPIG
jgi:hypothetical protein